VQRRARILASFLKYLLERRFLGLHQILSDGIEGINIQLRAGSSTIKTANYRSMVCAIQRVLLAFVFDKTGALKLAMRCFAFQMVKQSPIDGADEEDSEDEDGILNGENMQSTQAASAALARTKAISPSNALQLVKGLLHIFKTPLLTYLISKSEDVQTKAIMLAERHQFLAMEMRANASAGLSDAQINVQINNLPQTRELTGDLMTCAKDSNPLDKLEDDLKGSRTLSELALLVSKVSRIEEGEPSKEGKWKEHPSVEFGLCFSLGSNQVDGSTIMAMGTHIHRTAVSIFQGFLGGTPCATSLAMVENIVNPPSSEEAFFSLCSSQVGTRVGIKRHPSRFLAFEQEYRNSICKDPNKVLGHLEMLRTFLFGAIYCVSTATMRTTDLRLLDLGSFAKDGSAVEDTGNVFFLDLPDGRQGLLVATIIQKTLMEGVLIIPPFIARLLVLYLRFLAPICFREVVLKKAIEQVKDEQRFLYLEGFF
jgi:hypothetical protein